VRKHRILHADSEHDGFSAPSPLMNHEEVMRDLQREKHKELTNIAKKHKPLDPDPNDSSFEAYEKWLSQHNGDTRLWANQNGYEPQSLKSEFVEFKNGRLQHDSDICPNCQKHKSNCQCNQKQTKPFNFSYRS